MLYDNTSLHNSIYFGAFVLEGYIKILLINSGATLNGTPTYKGHLHNSSFINRLQSINPESFSNSLLEQNHPQYPNHLLNDTYNINYRYEVDKWINILYCQDVQNEIRSIKEELINLRIDGVLE